MDIDSTSPAPTPPAPAPVPPVIVAPKRRMHPAAVAGLVIAILALGYGAYAYFTNSWPLTPLEPLASEAPSPSPTEDPTAGWKTYTNTQYGYEFQYPNSLVLGTPQPRPGTGPFISLETLGTAERLALWAEECATGCMGSPYTFSMIVLPTGNEVLDEFMQAQGTSSSRVKITLDGRAAYEEVKFTEPQYTITTESEGNIYVLYFPQASSKADLSSDEKQILSTFKFTDPAAGWKTYTNTQYGFEFRHPVDWNTSSIQVKTPLNGYKYENPPAGTAHTYNAQAKTWSQTDSETPTPQTTASGIPWFLSGVTDGLGGAHSALIPAPGSNAMIEVWVGWGTCIEEPCPSGDPSETAKQELLSILATFRFTQ